MSMIIVTQATGLLGKNQFQEDKMNTEHKLFGFYLGLSAKQKILHLMKNYHYREYYVESYRQYIEGMIEDIRAYENNRMKRGQACMMCVKAHL